MVYIIFAFDNTDNNSRKGQNDSIGFEYDSSKTIREMLIDFIKKNNSILKIAGNDIESFEKTLNPNLLTFITKSKILNQEKNANKKVSEILRTNNVIVKIIDVGSILGGNKKIIYLNDKMY
jgi:hypothetical protein